MLFGLCRASCVVEAEEEQCLEERGQEEGVEAGSDDQEEAKAHAKEQEKEPLQRLIGKEDVPAGKPGKGKGKDKEGVCIVCRTSDPWRARTEG